MADFIWGGSKITADGDFNHEIKRHLLLEKESYDQPRQHIKSRDITLPKKGPSSQGYGFSSSHVWMWELDYNESWVPKSWCFWTMALEKEMATHSSVLAWRIPGPGEPGGLPSMGSHRVRHNWSDLAAAAAYVCQFQSPSLLPSTLPANHKFVFCICDSISVS